MQGATEELARFVANTRDIPDKVLQNAKLMILDTVGVILAATRDSGLPTPRAMGERSRERASRDGYRAGILQLTSAGGSCQWSCGARAGL